MKFIGFSHTPTSRHVRVSVSDKKEVSPHASREFLKIVSWSVTSPSKKKYSKVKTGDGARLKTST